jgi:hypothetical protein
MYSDAWRITDEMKLVQVVRSAPDIERALPIAEEMYQDSFRLQDLHREQKQIVERWHTT